MAKFADLPDDVLYALLDHITAADFILLVQTCRELHGLASTTYASSRLIVDLPLDLDDRELNPPDLQMHEVVTSLRIDANWKSQSTCVRRRTRFLHGDLVYFAHLLDDTLLFTLSRNHRTELLYLSAWLLPTTKSRSCRLGKIEPTFRGISLIPDKFSIAKHTKQDKALIAAFTDTGTSVYLQFFSLSLRRNDWHTNVPYPALDIEDSIDVTTRNPGLICHIHDIQIYDAIIVASYTERSLTTASEGLYYDLIILDIDHQHVRSITVGSHEDMAGQAFVFKLFQDSILVTTSSQDDGLASIYDRQQLLTSSEPVNVSFTAQPKKIHEINGLCAQYRSKYFSASYKIFLPTKAITNIHADVTAVAVENTTGRSYVFRIPIPRNKRPISDLHPISIEPHAHFHMKPISKLDSGHIWPAGHRMIWMEILSDGNDIGIMKAILPGAGEREVAVSELLPKEHLPMKYNDYVALWLDERRGCVCVSLLNQELLILSL